MQLPDNPSDSSPRRFPPQKFALNEEATSLAKHPNEPPAESSNPSNPTNPTLGDYKSPLLASLPPLPSPRLLIQFRNNAKAPRHLDLPRDPAALSDQLFGRLKGWPLSRRFECDTQEAGNNSIRNQSPSSSLSQPGRPHNDQEMEPFHFP